MQTDDAVERGAARTRRRGLVVATVVAAFIVVAASLTVRSSATRQKSLDASLPVLGGTGTISLADYRGRPVVLNFFASWCLFCIGEMPAFQRVYVSLGERVAFIGIATQDRPESALRLAALTKVSYDLADDSSGRVFGQLEANGMPTTVFVDREGRVVERFTGPLTEHALRDRIAEHFSI